MSLHGSKCKDCGITAGEMNDDGQFHFHHVDPNNKTMNISNHRGKKADIIKECVEKTVLVCQDCHSKYHLWIEQFYGRKKVD